MECEFLKGKRSDSNLLYVKDEKQIYKKNFASKKKTTYLCYIKNCKSRVYLNNNNGDLMCHKVSNFIEHNHDNQEMDYKQFKLLNEIKTECKSVSALKSGACVSVREIYEKHCLK